ncbi:LOW QUALITY PROTEIN: syntabulin-like [Phoenicopterus ruber ruber]
MPAASSLALRLVRERATALTADLRREAAFSSSSGTGSISAPEVHVSAAGSQRSSFSRNRGPYGRKNGSLSYESRASPPASREKDPLSTLCKSQLSPANIRHYGASSASSSNSGSCKGSNSSPAMRQVFISASGRYVSGGDNHSITPENPEQSLPPPQQKEVTVRHLKAELKGSESKLKQRAEIEELKAQLGRMTEEWIEEECHRVEAELAALEARREIQELKQLIESMKNSLAEKDRQIQKYFLDISIENKKLESLLQSMEMAQNRAVSDEQCLEYTCESEGKPLALCATMPDSLVAEDQALEEVADSGLLLNEHTANGTDDSFEEGLTTTTSELRDPAPASSAVKQEVLENVLDEKLTLSQEEEKIGKVMVEQGIQTDVVPYSLDVERLVQTIRAQDACPLSPPPSLKELGEFSSGSFSDSGILADLTPSDPNSAILLSPVASPCRKVEHGLNDSRFMEERFTEPRDDEAFGYVNAVSQTGIRRRYWNSSLLGDLLAVATPVVLTVMWVSTRREGTNPIYSIGAWLCGCGLVALHSLRRTPFSIKPEVRSVPGHQLAEAERRKRDERGHKKLLYVLAESVVLLLTL